MNTRKKLALRGNDLREELQADDAEADDPLREVSLQANGASPERLKGRQKPSTPHKLGAWSFDKGATTMKLNAIELESLHRISNGFWITRDDGKSLCDLKLAERGPVHGYVLTQAGIDALKSSAAN
jgi:hypothetical protein